MFTIALISCVSEKLDHRAKVRDIYTSPLFKKNMAYARKRKVDNIYILSAKHGLLALDDEIDPYDLTLNEMSTRDKNRWARRVFKQIKDHPDIPDIKDTKFIILAGENYRNNLEPVLPNVEIPMKGLPIGKQLQWLTQQTAP